MVCSTEGNLQSVRCLISLPAAVLCSDRSFELRNDFPAKTNCYNYNVIVRRKQPLSQPHADSTDRVKVKNATPHLVNCDSLRRSRQ